ncbi:MAG: hypothetical protein ABIQ49_11790 [Gemmatimonadales bacterium]
MIGAIGVSGNSPKEDEEIALAGPGRRLALLPLETIAGAEGGRVSSGC